MKTIGTIVIGATAFCAFSTSAFPQVRTFGPAAPYLITGRSVSVPAYHAEDQQSFDDAGGRVVREGDRPTGTEPADEQASPQ
jgi:hypothetical protein